MAGISLRQAIKEEKEFREVNYGYDDDDGPTDEDAIEHLMDECGKIPGHGCSLAGTEYCDWECPFS